MELVSVSVLRTVFEVLEDEDSLELEEDAVLASNFSRAVSHELSAHQMSPTMHSTDKSAAIPVISSFCFFLTISG